MAKKVTSLSDITERQINNSRVILVKLSRAALFQPRVIVRYRLAHTIEDVQLCLITEEFKDEVEVVFLLDKCVLHYSKDMFADEMSACLPD